jgi:hypothetical protein
MRKGPCNAERLPYRRQMSETTPVRVHAWMRRSADQVVAVKTPEVLDFQGFLDRLASGECDRLRALDGHWIRRDDIWRVAVLPDAGEADVDT